MSINPDTAADLFDWAAEDDSEALVANSRYEQMEIIGRGGMGMVRRAYDICTDRDVAYKVMLPGLAEKETMRQRFVREAEICAGLEHPHIMPVYDRGLTDDGQPFYTMKLLKGKTLDQILQASRKGERPPMSAAEALELLIKVSEAMAFAHQRGIIHRDLKAANVMIGAFGEVLVLDWGLAGRNSSAVGQSSLAEISEIEPQLTAVGQGGTPSFMAPEQAQPGRESGAAADIYALGGLLFSLLCPGSPWGNLTQKEIVQHLLHDQGPSLPDKVPNHVFGLPNFSKSSRRSAWALCRQALAGEVNQRCSSAVAFAQELQRLRDGFAVEAERASSLRRLTLGMRRHRGLVATCCFFLVIGAVFAEYSIKRISAEQHQARLDRQEAEASKLQAEESCRQAESSMRQAKESQRQAEEAMADLKYTAPVYLNRAQDSIRQGNFNAALVDIELYLKLNDKDAKAYELLGRVKMAQKSFAESMSAYGKGLVCAPDNPNCKIGLQISETAWGARLEDGSYSADALYKVYVQLVENEQMPEASALLDEIFKNKNYHAQLFKTMFEDSSMKGRLSFTKQGSLNLQLATPLVNLEALRPFIKAQFNFLSMRNLPVVDLEPIRGFQIHYLDLAGTAVRKLGALRDNMYLRELNLSRTKVSDLNPLKNLDIIALNLSATPVDDLSTLLTLKQLTQLDLSGLGHLDPAVVIDILPQLERVILPMQWRGKMGAIPLGLDVGWSNMPKLAAF